MPRPSQGYKNSRGEPVPATGDINGRWMDRSRLLYWAFNRGREGCAKLYDDSALNIGACVHQMIELDLRDRLSRDIEFYATTTLPDPTQLEKATISFAAFRKWRAEFHVDPHTLESSLVSERLQFGGTLDVVAHIRGALGLLEFKTSNELYEDHVMQLAAYSILWEEAHPYEPLASFHVVLLPKDGGAPIHREFTREQLTPFRQKFELLRRAYDLDRITNSAKMLKGEPVAPSAAPEQPAPKPKAPRKPAAARERVTIPPRPSTMGEMLRAYGHLREGVRA